MSHSIELFEKGAASIRDATVGEAMHSSIGPEAEARLVYVEPSKLGERLRRPGEAPLVLFDIGLGIAANSLAAIECCLGTGAEHRLFHLISFENSLKGISLALGSPGRFPWLARHHGKVARLLESGSWESPDRLLRWELRLGDFRDQELSGLPRPELIYFDFFSPRSSPELWSEEIFRRLRHAWPDSERDLGSEMTLLTYSASTSVRAAMLLAGFHVGYGGSTAAKLETTVASTVVRALNQPLGEGWLRKLERSSALLPGQANVLERLRTAVRNQA